MRTVENLLAWEIFTVVCRTGSISRTAVILDLELSKVSRLLSDLESELGIALLDKTHRPMTATPEGAAMLAQVTPLVEGFKTIRNELDGRRAVHTIRFSAPTELTQEFFTDYLMRYTAEHPNITFAIESAIAADDMREAEAEVAVTCPPKNRTGLIVRPYHTSTGCALASPIYLERFGCPKTPADLPDHIGLLQRSPNTEPSTELFRNGRSSGTLHWRRTFVSHDQLTLKRMVLEHQGIALDLFPGHVIKELRSGAIVPVLPEWTRRPWHMCIVTRIADEARSPVLRDFADWLAQYAADALSVMDRRIWEAFEENRRITGE